MTGYIWAVSAGGIITGGGTAADNDITVMWNASGAQTVSVTYTDPNGCIPVAETVLPVTVENCTNSLDIKVLLEGPYSGSGLMKTTLNGPPPLVPVTQPYNTTPWNYAGPERAAFVPADIVDWVLVELRDGPSAADALPATKLPGWPRAFLLKSDGSIVDLDGITHPDIVLPTIVNNLYVVIRHRNHLAIMSSSGATLTGNVYSYDFTTGLAQAFGGANGYKLAGSKAVMVAGDMDQDGNIFASDFNLWAVGFGATNGYFIPDLDMDRNVFVSDFNQWAVNFGSTIDSRIKSSFKKPIYFSCVPK